MTPEMTTPPRPATVSELPYEGAIQTALRELAVAREAIATARREEAEAEGRVAELSQAIQSLVARISPARRTFYLQQLGQPALSRHTAAPTRSSPVFSNVVELFAKSDRRDWTTKDVQAALNNEGVHADPKAVHNVLGYLARTGRLIRQGRGRYYVKGFGIGF